MIRKQREFTNTCSCNRSTDNNDMQQSANRINKLTADTLHQTVASLCSPLFFFNIKSLKTTKLVTSTGRPFLVTDEPAEKICILTTYYENAIKVDQCC